MAYGSPAESMGPHQGCPKPSKQGTNESEQIRTKPNELGKTGQKMGKKNGRTKPNPGETGQNQKFRQIYVRFCASLAHTPHNIVTQSCELNAPVNSL
jgi:hypothetical protein